nr:phospholipid-binding protein [Ensifer sp. IC4062]
MRTILTCLLTLALTGVAHAGMTVSFDWGPTKKCFDGKSPPMTLSGVPEGTTQLDIRMKDQNAPDFLHGGGKVAYEGQKSLPYGAFRYKGPCPPMGKHKYRFTVKALDSEGKVLGTAKADRMFP